MTREMMNLTHGGPPGRVVTYYLDQSSYNLQRPPTGAHPNLALSRTGDLPLGSIPALTIVEASWTSLCLRAFFEVMSSAPHVLSTCPVEFPNYRKFHTTCTRWSMYTHFCQLSADLDASKLPVRSLG